MRRTSVVVVAGAMLLASCNAGASPLGPSAKPIQTRGTAVVSKHVDGDTVRVRIDGREEKVRFIGIDTPETHGRNGLIECFGAQAAAYTEKLIPVGTAVRLVRDVEPRDRYGRLLAYLYRVEDELFVNLALARDGYADVLTYPPNVAHSADFVAAVAEARVHDRGLWSQCGSADVPLDPQ
ncbi:MAG TPA: thermonuclease family protein [Acidimicrobiales bacterium]|nr:thermonuclease family protein [Acidimicrobiales bacterium]